MEKKLRHLEMIQAIINRMANNSFMLKGWSVTLVAGIFTLSSKDADKLYFLVAYIPVFAFWGLDSFYLLQERLYRSLYDKVRNINEEDINFSLRAKATEFSDKTNKYINCFISKTELWFYLPLALACTIVFIIHKF